MSAAVADGKAWLRQTDEQGVSVYSHLTEVLATLLDKKPSNALAMLEGASLAAKGSHYAPAAVSVPEAPPELPAEPPVAGWASKTKTLLETVAKPLEEGTEQGVIADLQMERTLFECAGFGMSQMETYRVYAGLVSLQNQKNLSSVRLFGKVLGVSADYYIAEAIYASPPEAEEGDAPPPPPGAPVEAAGEGCNAYTYFACNDPAGEWTALPDVTPQQIVCSKKDPKVPDRLAERRRACVPALPRQREGVPARDDRADRGGDDAVPNGQIRL